MPALLLLIPSTFPKKSNVPQEKQAYVDGNIKLRLLEAGDEKTNML